MGVLFFATPRHEAGSAVKITSLGQNIMDLSALQNSLALQTEKLRKYNLLAEKVVDKAQSLATNQASGGLSNKLGGRVQQDLDQLLNSQEEATIMYDDLKFLCKFGKVKGADSKATPKEFAHHDEKCQSMMDAMMADMKALKAVMPADKKPT